LRPSGTNRGFAGADLVTAGGGAWGDLDYITSALTADARWLLAYAPVTEQGPRAFEVDLGVMNGPVRARWFDPATGNYLAISDGYELDNTGTLSVSTPGSREDGTDDWLLVLDAGDVPRCGTISPTGTYTAPPAATVGVTCEVTATLASDLSVVARQPLVVG
jgi:Putative collagen-binding domain of a collagenase